MDRTPKVAIYCGRWIVAAFTADTWDDAEDMAYESIVLTYREEGGVRETRKTYKGWEIETNIGHLFLIKPFEPFTVPEHL